MDAATLPSLKDALPEAQGLAEAAETVRAAATALRTRFAPARVVVVDAFDMRDETPAAVGAKYQLWFGASDGHCWQVTVDPAKAVGFFIADKS